MTTDAALARAAAEAGAAEVRARYGAPVDKYFKSDRDFATEADLEAERAIFDVIAQARPDDAFEGEEGGLVGIPTASRTWLVDPLCGTLNFAARTPLVAVNVALRHDGRLTAAAAADPFSGETFWTDGDRAWVRRGDEDVPLAPSGDTRLVDVDLNGDVAWSAALISSAAYTATFGTRVVSSSLGLTWVAAGRRAAYVQVGDVRDNVHFAAGIALCRAAGCVVTGLGGEPLESGPVGLLAAADGSTHERLLEAISALDAPRR